MDPSQVADLEELLAAGKAKQGRTWIHGTDTFATQERSRGHLKLCQIVNLISWVLLHLYWHSRILARER